MSGIKNKRLVKRYYEEVVNKGMVDLIPDFIAPEYTEVYNDKRYKTGRKGAEAHVLGVRKTYPDLHLTIDQQIAEGEWVVSRIRMRGTHLGEWLGIQPTGKHIEVSAVNIDRVIDGQIVEHGGAANMLEPLLEIGAIKINNPGTG